MGKFVFLILQRVLLDFTLVQNNQKSRHKYWATSSSVCLFTRSLVHSFACSTLLALLTGSLFLSLARASSLFFPVSSSLFPNVYRSFCACVLGCTHIQKCL